MQAVTSIEPSTLDGAETFAKNSGCFFLRKTLIVEEIDDLPLFFWKLVAIFVEQAPLSQVLWLIRFIQGSASVIGRLVVGVVVGPVAFWSEVVPCEVVEFPSNLDPGEIEEVFDRFHTNVLQGSMQSDHCILKNIVGSFPAAEIGVVPEGPPGDPQQSVAGMLKQRLSSRLIAP